MGWSLEKLCTISSSSSNSPRVAADGAPLPGDTDRETYDAAEQPVDKPGNQNPRDEEAETSQSSVSRLMRWKAE